MLYFIHFQFEREKLSTVEDQSKMFSKLAAKVCTKWAWIVQLVTSLPFLSCVVINTIRNFLLFHVQPLNTKKYKFMNLFKETGETVCFK